MDGEAKGERVLVADDDPDVRRMLGLMVERWGLEPVVASDGTAALAMLTGCDPPERAVLDWMMPGLSGPEVCRRARAAGSRAHVVMLTARDRPECVIEGLEAGADDYVVKPFDAGVLRARLMRGGRAPVVTDGPIAPGLVIAGRFRLEQRIGEGGMGTVYRAVHVELGHALAVKLVRPELVASPALRARFETEARAASLLRSPHVVQVFDYGITPGGTPYIIMEYLRGQTLGALLTERGALPFPIVTRLMSELARGLSVAHAAGIVHRDVKPENVFLEDIGDDSGIGLPFRAKLVDFGLARLVEGERSARTTAKGGFVGTLGFASPEQLGSGEAIGPRADLWALGATTFAAATGRPAITEGPEATMAYLTKRAMIPAPSEILPSLPPAFDAWMRRACAAAVDDRFPDALTMARALRAVLG